MLSCCQVGVFTSDGHGLLEGDVFGEAEAVDEAALVGSGEVVLADELVPVPRPGARLEDAPACWLVGWLGEGLICECSSCLSCI